MSRFLEKLEFVKPADLVSGLKMLVSIPYAACLKKKRKQMWLVCEEYNEARDNGYWLYKYIRKAHPEQDVVYAINKESVDYEKIKKSITSCHGNRTWIYCGTTGCKSRFIQSRNTWRQSD